MEEGLAEAVPRKVIPSEAIGARIRRRGDCGQELRGLMREEKKATQSHTDRWVRSIPSGTKKGETNFSVRTRIRTWVVAELRYHNTTI